jgi:hypothetical protein
MSHTIDKRKADKSVDRLRSLAREVLRLRDHVARANGRLGSHEDRAAARDAFDLVVYESLLEAKRLERLFVDVDRYRVTFDQGAEDVVVAPLVHGPDLRAASIDAIHERCEAERYERDNARYQRRAPREERAA